MAARPLDAIIARYRQGEVDTAITQVRAALAAGPDQPDHWIWLGVFLRRKGAPAASHRALSAGRVIAPDNGFLANNLVVSRGDESLVDPAAVLGWDDPVLTFNLARWLAEREDAERAEILFRRAVALAPDDGNRHLEFLHFLVLTTRLRDREDDLAAARRALGDDPRLRPFAARLRLFRGDAAGARDLLAGEPPAEAPAHILSEWGHVLGRACEALGDHDGAFAAHGRAKAVMAAQGARTGVDGRAYLGRLTRLRTIFTPAWVAGWTPDPAPAPAPVFLVGFPRSGTTLLDSILRSHPGIRVVEERPLVDAMAQAMIEDLPGSFPEGLAHLGPGELTHLRRAYFTALGAPAETLANQCLVDKFPLNLTHAGFIRRVFPDARFILALRHPCDCVLSTLFTGFQPNPAMANLCRMEDAAHLYDRVFDLWQHYRTLWPLAVHTIHYEDLVEDFEPTVRGILDFLGLDWDPAVHDFAETARRRSRIRTPSNWQVTQGVYRHALGRWHDYRHHLEPILPILSPWAEFHGYGQP